MGAGGLDVVDRTRQRGRSPEQATERIGDDLHIHAVLLVLAGVEGSVRGDAVDRQQGAVQDHERLRCRCPDGLFEAGGQGGQDLDGLADVPVDGGDADVERRSELTDSAEHSTSADMPCDQAGRLIGTRRTGFRCEFRQGATDWLRSVGFGF